MTWKEKLVEKIKVSESKLAIIGVVIIVISGHFHGLNGDLTLAALAILGTYGAIQKKRNGD